MARRGQPVLYELLGADAANASAGTRPAPGRAEGGPVTGARQSVRVPIGWFWLSAVIALVLMAVAYQFGRSAGDRAGFARGQEWRTDRDDQSRLTGQTPDPAATPRDTRREQVAGGRGTQGAGDESSRSRNSGAAGRESGRNSTVDASDAGASSSAVTGDPRVRGLNYWVVARPGAEEAEQVAAFVRSNGLEVAVVPDNNARFRRVIAIPGYQSVSDPRCRETEARIRSIGKLWKNAARGNRDFDDTYLERYR